jgi:hypothetical protein
MTASAPASRRGRSLLLMLCAGGAIGTVVALALYVTKPAIVALLPAAVALVLATAFFRQYRLYWFGIFLLSLQFSVSKNLNDGFAVIDRLKIDYIIENFTFSVTATDLALFVLLGFAASDRMFHGKTFRFPKQSWLAVGYIGIAAVSTVLAPSHYLGAVELVLQIKYFIVYLFAVNCLDSKSAFRVLALVGVAILVTQGATTITRFQTGWLMPIGSGDSHQDLSHIQEYLTIDRSDPYSAIRAFGTLGSPGTTIRLTMMLIPFALLLSVRNAMCGTPLLFATLTAFGLVGLVFTFTRVYYITTSIQCLLAFAIMVRDGMLKRETVVLVVLLGVGGAVAVSPLLYRQFTVREDSMTVRLQQYEAAIRMIVDKPLLGVGLNNGTALKPNYVVTTYNKYDADTQYFLEPTHNLYLSMASEIGLPGMLLYVAFFGHAGWIAWRTSRRAADAEIRLVANALVVVFSSVAVNAAMDPLHEYPVLTLLWLYAGVSCNLPALGQCLPVMAPGPVRTGRRWSARVAAGRLS